MVSTTGIGEHEPLCAADIDQWTHDSEVVVVGHGGAGATAAVEARRNGAEVLVLEKTPDGGGTTEQAGGYFYLGGGTPLQERHGFDDTPEKMRTYLSARNPNTAEERIRAFVDESLETYRWLEELGLTFEGPLIEEKTVEPEGSHLAFTGSEQCFPYRRLTEPVPRGHHVEDGGAELFELLDETAREEGVEFLFETAAGRLVVDSQRRRVVGVQATRDGEQITVRARKGVVIATSGFSYNEEMLEQHVPEYPDKGVPLGTYYLEYPDRTIHDGSGIKMATAVGAKTVGMDDMLAVGYIYPYDVQPPGDGSLNQALVSGILVNAEGRRFINEDRYGCDITREIVENQHAEELPGNPASAHLILDDELVRMGGGLPDDDVVNFRTETLTKAERIDELAAKLDLPADVLANTVAFYNEQAREGRDPEHHKHDDYLKPLDTPPYYAYFLRPAALSGQGLWYHTLGGLQVNLSGEVYNSSEETIDGLYAVSRAISGITGENYESGMSLTENVFFGRRAGRAVASVSPVE